MCGETNYLRNQKRKIKMVRKCGKNIRRKIKVFKNTPCEKGLLESQERDG
jgi:hypothetical protein